MTIDGIKNGVVNTMTPSNVANQPADTETKDVNVQNAKQNVNVSQHRQRTSLRMAIIRILRITASVSFSSMRKRLSREYRRLTVSSTTTRLQSLAIMIRLTESLSR